MPFAAIFSIGLIDSTLLNITQDITNIKARRSDGISNDPRAIAGLQKKFKLLLIGKKWTELADKLQILICDKKWPFVFADLARIQRPTLRRHFRHSDLRCVCVCVVRHHSQPPTQLTVGHNITVIACAS